MSDTPATELSPEALAFFREAGSKGGKRTVKLHGKEHFAEIGRKGGKVTRKKTIKPRKKRASKA